MPTAFALARRRGAGAAAAGRACRAAATRWRWCLWGSDNIKSDGGPIAQALALMGARPRFDHYGRLCGADLIPLAELGRPRIDVVMTLSGIFRDLLPLQTRMLAEAAWKAATADEPASQNFIRAHSLAYAEADGRGHGNRRPAGVLQRRRGLWRRTSTRWSAPLPLGMRMSWPMPTRRANALPMGVNGKPVKQRGTAAEGAEAMWIWPIRTSNRSNWA